MKCIEICVYTHAQLHVWYEVVRALSSCVPLRVKTARLRGAPDPLRAPQPAPRWGERPLDEGLQVPD